LQHIINEQRGSAAAVKLARWILRSGERLERTEEKSHLAFTP
jgi:hypothetical protein